MITIDDFTKVELKVGTVLESEAVEESEKLINLTVDFGEENPRTILTGIKAWYIPEYFVGKQLIFITNLEPRKMMGLQSQGMIMAADSDEGPILLTVEKKAPNGAKVR